MKSSQILSLIGLSFVLALLLVSLQVEQAEAGAKKMLKHAALAALLMTGGKKILLPLPIPVPIPVLRQTQPIYYQQPSYSHSYDSHSSY